MRAHVPLLAAAFALISCAGPATDPNPPDNTGQPVSWEEFQGLAYQEPDTGIYVINGDEIHETLNDLRTSYDKYVREFDQVGTTADSLIVNLANGQDDKWSASVQNNITYCVDPKTFGSNYAAVVSAMESAGAAWHAAANVTFVHSASLDNKCSWSSATVFNVREVCPHGGTTYLARSFFPSTSRKGREVLINCTSFGAIAPYTLAGILRHELGHTLGFRHEHTRPESGACFEDNNWRALTSYDPASVMHYPQCNGTNTGDLDLTTLDKSGAHTLYP